MLAVARAVGVQGGNSFLSTKNQQLRPQRSISALPVRLLNLLLGELIGCLCCHPDVIISKEMVLRR